MQIWQNILAAIGLKHSGEEMTPADYEFMKYVTEYGKHYGTKEEFNFRAEIFKKNLAVVEEHNSRNGETHVAGINHMSDWTEDEYKALLGYRPELKAQTNAEPEYLPEDNLADSLNWVTQGAVTGVKNQGQCGSCWAFSSTGAIEGAEFLHGTKQLTSLSEQNLVDCSKKNHACQGGLMDYAFEYVMENPLMTEGDYPYTGTHHLWTRCKYEKSKGVGRVAGYKDVAKSAAQLKAALANGPVSVAIEADKSVFQSYKSGVLTGTACGTQLDHGVLAVGYGTENGTPYFLVKNSWGASWGDNGYIKIGQNNVCGILQQASYPTE